MANYCNNHMIIDGISTPAREKLIEALGAYKEFNYLNDWANSFISKKNQVGVNFVEGDKNFDPYAYGSRWWVLEVDSSDPDHIVVSGDSAWSPMVGLAKAISQEFECEVNISYEESGCDFGGEIEFDNGSEDVKFEGSYSAYSYYCGGIHNLFENYEWIETVEDYEAILDDVREVATDADFNAFREEFKKFDVDWERDQALGKFLKV